MTLQQAALAVIDRWDRNEYTNAYLGVHITALRKALEAEEAQAVKSNIEFLYEELRKATDGGSEFMTHDDALKQIAHWRGKCSQVHAVEPVCRNCIGTGWEPHMYRDRIPCSHCHPPPAMHLSEILAEKGIKLRTEFEPKPGHIVDSNKMVGERAELIARLQEAQVMMDYDPIEAHAAMGAAIDMLEADAQEINAYRDHANLRLDQVGMALRLEMDGLKAQQVAVSDGWVLVPIVPTPEMCAEGLEDEGVTIKDGKRYAYALYRAMLAATPQPPQGDKP